MEVLGGDGGLRLSRYEFSGGTEGQDSRAFLISVLAGFVFSPTQSFEWLAVQDPAPALRRGYRHQ